MTKHLPEKERKNMLIEAALGAAEAVGYAAVTRAKIAEHAGVSDALVSQHLGTMTNTRRLILRHAIKQQNLRVIAQGLVAREPTVLKAPRELQARAAQSLV